MLGQLDGIRSARADIEKLLSSDESAALEFKSVLRLPVGLPKPGEPRSPEKLDPVLKYPALKSLAAFLNTDGGTLIIGVTDNQRTVGIEADFPHHKGSIRDAWRLAFDGLVSRYLGGEALNYIDLQLEPWQGRTIAIIRCSPSREPTWIGDDLYVRRTASTEKLSTPRPGLVPPKVGLAGIAALAPGHREHHGGGQPMPAGIAIAAAAALCGRDLHIDPDAPAPEESRASGAW